MTSSKGLTRTLLIYTQANLSNSRVRLDQPMCFPQSLGCQLESFRQVRLDLSSVDEGSELLKHTNLCFALIVVVRFRAQPYPSECQ
jgi:hypothetical protein